MHALIINGYSAANHGDGLLVDLAVDLLREAYGADTTVTAAVNDIASFGSTRDYDLVPTFGGTAPLRIATGGALALATAGRIGFSRAYRDARRRADLVASVGGAYLRGGHAGELAKSSLAHLSQMRAASRSETPWVMLPQSVGPYGPLVGGSVRRTVERADAVFLRDDTSMREYGTMPRARRLPDSAVLALAGPRRRAPRSGSGRPAVGVVLRALRAPGTYERDVRAVLADAPFEAVPVLQATVSGNDDRPCYGGFGLDPVGTLDAALGAGGLDAVLSVRLHGALESLLHGVPAVHLSYERKGFSAFADLGLERYVFDARGFDPRAVRARLLEIGQDPARYWESLDRELPAIRRSRDEVIRILRSLVA